MCHRGPYSAAALALIAVVSCTFGSSAQDGGSPNEVPVAASAPQTPPEDAQRLTILQLAYKGGWLMLPLLALSMAAMGIAIERALALRQTRVFPDETKRVLDELAHNGGPPSREDVQRCAEIPRLTLQAAIARQGHALTDVENAYDIAVEQAWSREKRLIQWLMLTVAVAPLIGLLGTVQGMILAFQRFTFAGPTSQGAEKLAEGIYTALVTTAAGLAVAIFALIAAHLLKIQLWRLAVKVDASTRPLLTKLASPPPR